MMHSSTAEFLGQARLAAALPSPAGCAARRAGGNAPHIAPLLARPDPPGSPRGAASRSR